MIEHTEWLELRMILLVAEDDDADEVAEDAEAAGDDGEDAADHGDNLVIHDRTICGCKRSTIRVSSPPRLRRAHFRAEIMNIVIL